MDREIHEVPEDCFELEFVAANQGEHEISEDTFLRASDEVICLSVRNFTGQVVLRRTQQDLTQSPNISRIDANSSFFS